MSDNSKHPKSNSWIGILVVLLGVGLLCVAGKGVNEIWKVSISGTAEMDQFPIASFVWNHFDDPANPKKPSAIARSVSSTLYGVGLLGLFVMAIGITLVFVGRSKSR